MKTIKFRHDEHKRYWISEFSKIKISLPPVEVQKEIVKQIEVKQNVIDHAKAIIQNLERERRYFGQSLKKLEGVKRLEIGSTCNLINGKAFKPSDWQKQESGGLPIIRIQNLNNVSASFNYYTGKVSKQIIIKTGDLLFSWSGSRGTSFGAHIWKGKEAILNQHIFKVEHSDDVDRKYLYFALNDAVSEIEQNLHGGVGLVHITKGNLEKIKIPIPPLKTQKRVVANIEKEEKIIEANKKLIGIMEQKIADVLSEI